MSVNHWILLGSLITMVLSGVASVVLYVRVLAALRQRHRSTWEDLGAPTLVLNNSLRNALRFWIFNVRREYRRLRDPEMPRLFWWMNAVSILYGLSFAFLFSVLVATAIRG